MAAASGSPASGSGDETTWAFRIFNFGLKIVNMCENRGHKQRHSHGDRGLRPDEHDAIGKELRVNDESGPEPSSKRNRQSIDPEPDRIHLWIPIAFPPRLEQHVEAGGAPQHLGQAAQKSTCSWSS